MLILVTGGTGLVGNAIQNIKDDYDDDFIFLSSKECDLSNYDETFDTLNKYKPDYIIHLAACVGGLFKNMNFKVDMLEKNILINYNILKCAHELDINNIISCLSTCIFPDKTTYPINENMLHNGPPHSSNDAYAYSKRILEIHSKAYQEQYNRNYYCIIPTNIYGENDQYNLEDSHVIPGLIHRCYLAKKNNEKFIVRGTGKPLRQFIYSMDLAKIIMYLLYNYNEKTSIIISVNQDEEVSINTVANIIAKTFDYEHMIEFDNSYSDGQYKKTADNNKLMSILNNNFIFTDINTGIIKSVNWFINNYNNCRK